MHVRDDHRPELDKLKIKVRNLQLKRTAKEVTYHIEPVKPRPIRVSVIVKNPAHQEKPRLVGVECGQAQYTG